MRKSTIVLLVMCMSAGSVQAGNWDWLTQYKKPNIHLGQLALHPSYDFSQTYDSNIYLVPRDQANGVVVGSGKRESWITKNNLGLEAELPWRTLHKLALGYGVEFQNYTTQPDLNDAINQRLHGDYTYAGAYGLTFKVGDKYVNTTDQAFSELVGRNQRWQNIIYTSLDYYPEHGRLAGGIDASQKNDKYLGPVLGRLLNRYEDTLGFNVGYKVMPKTKAYVSYHRGIVHYSVPAQGLQKDSRSHSVGAGVIGSLTAKLEGQIEGGATYRQYDVAPVSGASRIFVSPTVATTLTYKADANTTVILNLSRYLEESIDPSNPFYYSNNASLDVKHKFPRKFSAGANL
ncbi:MAG: outer membrane beta-barrel protein, partial [Elusimicrobiota bacterium]